MDTSIGVSVLEDFYLHTHKTAHLPTYLPIYLQMRLFFSFWILPLPGGWNMYNNVAPASREKDEVEDRESLGFEIGCIQVCLLIIVDDEVRRGKCFSNWTNKREPNEINSFSSTEYNPHLASLQDAPSSMWGSLQWGGEEELELEDKLESEQHHELESYWTWLSWILPSVQGLRLRLPQLRVAWGFHWLWTPPVRSGQVKNSATSSITAQWNIEREALFATLHISPFSCFDRFQTTSITAASQVGDWREWTPSVTWTASPIHFQKYNHISLHFSTTLQIFRKLNNNLNSNHSHDAVRS